MTTWKTETEICKCTFTSLLLLNCRLVYYYTFVQTSLLLSQSSVLR